MWGQGLKDDDKIHQVLARMLRTKYPDQIVEMLFLAHSGASTGFNPDGTVNMHHEPRIHGEVPTLYPTILQQIEEFDELGVSPDSITAVILDAGINDVNLLRILNPLIPPAEIEEQVEIYCHRHMQMLVEKLVMKFKNAKIIIAAYYEFITEDSHEEYVRHFLKAFENLLGGLIANVLVEVADRLTEQRLLANSDTFVERSLAAFEDVAQKINSQFKNPRVFVAVPEIKTENAAFASDPWLFGIKEDLSAEDPLASERVAACYEAGLSRTQPIFCERASAGHPNPKGAKAYAEAIYALL